MTPIDWRSAQAKLGVTADGVAGPRTYDALCAYIAGRKPEEVDDRIARGLVAYANRFGQDASPQRLADFLAQCCNETGGWRAWEENLRYSAASMLRVWPSHFTPITASAAVGHPVEVASRAYGGRMGNSPYPSHDGYTFRGRGALQLTGRANYKRFGEMLGIDLTGNPDLAATPDTSILIALEFFRLGKVNDAIDASDFAGARRITNVGSRFAKDKAGRLIEPIGLEHVADLRKRALKVLA